MEHERLDLVAAASGLASSAILRAQVSASRRISSHPSGERSCLLRTFVISSCSGGWSPGRSSPSSPVEMTASLQRRARALPGLPSGRKAPRTRAQGSSGS
jgi:hypothetical protein